MIGGATYFEISPVHQTKKKGKETEVEEIPLLRLIQFTHSPKFSFETVKLGSSKQKRLHILNPKDQLQEVFCEKYPSEEDGFSISPMHAVVLPGETIEIMLVWTPKAEGNMRELIHWKTSIGVRSQTVLLGTCVNPNPKTKKKQGARGLTTNPIKQPLRLHNQQNIPTKTKSKFILSEKAQGRCIKDSLTRNPETKFSHAQISNPRQCPVPKLRMEPKEIRKKPKSSNKENCVKFSDNIIIEEYTNEKDEYQTKPLNELTNLSNENIVYKSLVHEEARNLGDSGIRSMRLDSKPKANSFNVADQVSVTFCKDITVDHLFPSSPARRQTYIKSDASALCKRLYPDSQTTVILKQFSESHFESCQKMYHDATTTVHVSNDLEDYSSMSNPKAPQITTLSTQEQFGDARKGLTSCDVKDSPIRRQTYVKHKCAELQTSTEKAEEQECEDSRLDFTISTPPAGSLSSENLWEHKLSPFTPNVLLESQNKNIRESCAHLLHTLESMFGSPRLPPPSSSFDGTRSLPTKPQESNFSNDGSNQRGQKLISTSVPLSLNVSSKEHILSVFEGETSLYESLHTTPCSPAEFVTAPSTPAEVDCTLQNPSNSLDNDFNTTQEFPTPKICTKPIDLTDLSTLLEAERIKMLNNTLSPDSLERSQPDLKLCSLSPVASHPNQNVNLTEDLGSYPHQRLLQGTGTMEDSVVHSNDIKLDSENPPKEFDSSPCVQCPVEGNDVFLLPLPIHPLNRQPYMVDKVDGQSTLEPLGLSEEVSFNHSRRVLGILNAEDVVTPDRLGTVSNSETLASLSDFSFLPVDHPKHCSTMVKSPPTMSNLFTGGGNLKGNAIKKLFDNQMARTSSNTTKVTSSTISSEMSLIEEKEECLALIQRSVEVDPRSSTFTLNSDKIKKTSSEFIEEPVKQEKCGLAFIAISSPRGSGAHRKRRSVDPKPAVRISIPPRRSAVKSTKLPTTHQATISGSKMNLPKSKIFKAQSTLSLPSHSKANGSKKDKGENLFSDAGTSSMASIDELSSSMLPGLKSSSSSSSRSSCFREFHPQKLKKTLKFLSHSRLMLNQMSCPRSWVHHPNPFAARNMYYDDRWIEKQARGYTKWLNFVLTPPDEENSVDKKVDITKLWMEANRCSNMARAPSRETMSLKMYTARKRLGKLRRAACKLYQSPEVARVIHKVEMAVEKKLISIRKDRETHADFGLKQEMLKLTLCFNPLWLRIGLETVYGEVIFLNSNSDIYGLSLFIIYRLLNCPDIGKRFAHPTVPFSYKRGFEEALKTLQLKRFLKLIYFLDRAKTARLIDHDPCLFNKESGFKTTREVLLAFAREFLCGVGDITKHLSYLGYNVSHQQTPLDEFDYAVTNLETDLRCGIRLTRVCETLLQDFTLSKNLRLPAVSRLQKMHNTDVALKALDAAGVIPPGHKYASKDIIDGHQEKTLALLWDIIFSLQIKNILSVSRLVEEIGHLRKTLLVKELANSVAPKTALTMKRLAPSEVMEADETSSSELILRLLKFWVRIVCAHYGLEVDNLTVSFCDGRAFCLILHHYHGDMLKREEIHMKTTQNLPAPGLDLNVSSDDSSSEELYIDNEEIERRLLNDKANFHLFISKINELGGVPILIRPGDMINTIPDEKVTTTFLAYFCARLLDLSAEIKAVRVIQLAWRRKLARIRMLRIERQRLASIKVQRWWRKCLKAKYAALYRMAALVFQCHWRRLCAQRELLRLRHQKELYIKNEAARMIQKNVRRFLLSRRILKQRAVIVIQSHVRRYLAWKKYITFKKSCLIIQKTFRMQKEVRRFQTKKLAAIVIQKRIRQWKISREKERKTQAALRIQRYWRMRQQRKEFSERKNACIVLQAGARMVIARKTLLKKRAAAIMIQRWFVAVSQRRRDMATYRNIRRAAVLLQSQWRMILEKRRFQELKVACVVVQQRIRAYLSMKKDVDHYKRIQKATLLIQSLYRGWMSRNLLKKQFVACIKIQTWFRRLSAQFRYRQIKAATLVLQLHIRQYLTHKRLKERKMKEAAALTIQRTLRMILLRKNYLTKRQAVVVIQKYIRMWIECDRYHKLRKSVCVIQTFFRGHLMTKNAVTKFQLARDSAIIVQAAWKSYMVRKEFLAQKQASICIQKWYQNCKVIKNHKQELKKRKKALILLQAAIRGYNARQAMTKRKEAIVKIQTCIRQYLDKRKFLTLKKATVTIQDYYRSYKTMSIQRNHYLLVKNKVIRLQSCIRSYLATKKFTEIKISIVKIQAWWKMHLELRRYKKILLAVHLIQYSYRSHLLMVNSRMWYENQRKSAIKIQALTRGYLSRKKIHLQHRNAMIIQSAFRGYFVCKHYKLCQRSANLIQTYFRRYLMTQQVRRRFLDQRKSVILVQSLIRGYLIRRSIERKHKAAVKIQSTFRMWRAKKIFRNRVLAANIIQVRWRATLLMKEESRKFRVQRRAVLALQAIWRGKFCRKEQQRKHKAATKIQSIFRGWRERESFKVKQKSVGIIEDWWSNCSVSYSLRIKFVAMRRAAIIIQRFVRVSREKHKAKLQDAAATKIQASWKMARLKGAFLQKREAIVFIQRWWRSHLKTKQIRCHYLYLQGCIIIIQAHCRGLLTRRMFSIVQAHQAAERAYKMETSARIIQQWWHACLVRREFVMKREAVIVLQTYWRGIFQTFIAREYFIYLRRASVIIQAAWRARCARKQYRKTVEATITIQRVFRDWVFRKELNKERRLFVLKNFARQIRFNIAAIKIQRWFRRRRHFEQNFERVVLLQRFVKTVIQRRRFRKVQESTLLIQRWWRKVITRKMQRRWNASATTIQRHWRGYATRKALLSNRRVTQIRGRLLEANAMASEENTIGTRTDLAIISLRLSRDVKRVLIAVMILDNSTRWSPICCEKLLSSKETLETLSFLLKSCNRSLPHMEILTHVLNTLITLAKFDRTRPEKRNFYDLIPSVIHLTKIYYDKGPSVFLKCCTFLYILATCEPFPKALLLKIRDLNSVCNGLRRKQEFQSKGKVETRKLVCKLPSITPDWAMRPTEVREFSQPLAGVLALKKIVENMQDKRVAFNLQPK